jgi:hypothetical protein
MPNAQTPAPDATDLIADYRYPDKTKKNIPLAGMPVKAKVKEQPKHRYEYDPHLPPALRFDPTGKADEPPPLPPLLEIASSGLSPKRRRGNLPRRSRRR